MIIRHYSGRPISRNHSYKTLSKLNRSKMSYKNDSEKWMARIVSYNHDSENFEINWIDRQMSYKDNSETHKNLSHKKVSYKMDSPVRFFHKNGKIKIFDANEKIFERKLFISQSEMVAVISLARSSGHKIEDQIMAQANTLTTSDWSTKVKPDWPETLLNLTEGG